MLARGAHTESFRAVFSTTVPVEELTAWLRSALPGHQAVYATGLDLPRASETVRHVTRWKDDGLVTTNQRRDPADARRWQFLVTKTGGQPSRSPDAPVGDGVSPLLPTVADRSDLRRLLSTLRSCAERNRPCPSLSAIADELGLAVGEKGRQRAAYLMRRLEKDRSISTVARGTNMSRPVIRITAPGRAHGKATAG